jgi:hypothetical protein
MVRKTSSGEVHEHTRKEARVEPENARLKRLGGGFSWSEKKRRVAGMKRRQALRVSQQAESLLPRIQALKAERPFWG